MTNPTPTPVLRPDSDSQVLQPCPFCGGAAFRCMDYRIPTGKVKCRDCQTVAPSETAWNTRVDAVELLAVLTEARNDVDKIDATPFGRVERRLDALAERLDRAIALAEPKP